MSPFFDQSTRSNRPRAISNGGLGGFVQVDQLIWDHVNGSKTTWPKRKKQRPPPIDVGIDGRLLLTTLTSTSVVVPGCRTPVTPGTPWTMNTTNAAVTDMTPSRTSPPVSRNSVAGQARIYTSMPGTPSTPEPKFKSEPVELPGSLLLPSQGFPQSEPPVTPARQTFGRSYSGASSSTLSPIPGLSTCSTVTTNEMDVLKSFSPMKKEAKPTTSSTSTTSVPQIGKPFSAMTAEELIQCLPQCSPSTIYNTWVPAMLREHQKIKNLLQGASEIKTNENFELRDFSAKIESISNDARKISNTYEHALLRAESLSERDNRTLQKKLESTEADLHEALTAADSQRDILSEKEEVIKALQHNTNAIVHMLGGFIEDALPHCMDSIESERIHQVMQVIADYSPSIGGPRSTLQLSSPFLRIPGSMFRSHLKNLRDNQAKAQSYQNLAQEQANLIKSQSVDLDQRVIEYEKCIRTIKERDHRILLLVEQNNAQKKAIQAYESGEKVAESVEAEQERLINQHQNTEWTIKNLKMDHAKQIEDRDAEIDNLRQKLGHAWKEVLARKADMKNVISQTQALLASPELLEAAPDTLSPREEMGVGRDKTTRGAMSSSRSMLSLSVPETSPGFGSLDTPTAPLSAVERITSDDKSSLQFEPRSPHDEGWGCGIARKRTSIQNLRRAFSAVEDLKPRLRNNPLGTTSNGRRSNDRELLETLVKGSLNENPTAASTITEKALPTPPETHHEYGSIYNSDGGRSVTEEVLENILLHPEAADHNFGSPVSQWKRVLSGIPEMSAEDSESQKSSPSATKGDKEVYKKSIATLSLIESKRESDMQKSAAVSDYEGNEHGPVELGVAYEVRVRHGSRSSLGFQNEAAHLQPGDHAGKGSLKR